MQDNGVEGNGVCTRTQTQRERRAGLYTSMAASPGPQETKVQAKLQGLFQYLIKMSLTGVMTGGNPG